MSNNIVTGQIVPLSLQGKPSLIERLWPAQKISAESETERKAVSGQSLTGLGGYWKGRKPLVLNRACILGALIPASDDGEKDLAVFEALMQIDDEAFTSRIPSLTAREASVLAAKHGVLQGPQFAEFFSRADEETDWDVLASEGLLKWSRDADAAMRNALKRRIVAALPYRDRLDLSLRPEELGQTIGAGVWAMANAHLGTSATSIPGLVHQLGVMRFGRTPRVGDAFSGSGQIPFEALRMGCDTYASDPNPIAALLTWSSFNVAGADPETVAELTDELAKIERSVEDDLAAFEINAHGDRAKAYLYCVEVQCPETGFMVPLAPNWIISPKTGVVGRLRTDHATKRIEVDIVTGATAAEVKAAAVGTVTGDFVQYELDGQTHRFSIGGVRGDHRAGSMRSNRLRKWDADDVAPAANDVFGERLYCIQWARAESLNRSRQEVVFAAPTAADLAQEADVLAHVHESLKQWRADGLVADMTIEPGLKTDDPIRTRGWTNWLHLFHPRQIVMLANLHNRIKASPNAANLYYFMPRALDNNSRLNRWASGQGGGIGGPKGTFDNQALNTLINFAVRSSLGMRSLVGGPARPLALTASRQIETIPGDQVTESQDIWITDPPYADAVVYHELTEFFISWLRRSPPAPFDAWLWDSRRPLAIQGEGEDFRRRMVQTYTNLAKHMTDDGLQIVMFTHQSGSVWADLAQIFWGSGLQVTAAWYIATETGSNAPGKKGIGLVQGTVILVLRKRSGVESGYEDEIVRAVRTEVANQIDTLVGLNQTVKGSGRLENLFEDSDLQMAGYAAALRVLTGFTKIDGRDMTAEALRPRRKGEVGFVERMIDFAVGVANEHMVPTGLLPRLWQQLSGPERFYLKMVGHESAGLSKLDNYQNFAKAFRVGDYAVFMGSLQPNAARLKTAVEFGSRFGFDIPAFGNGLVRAALFGIDALAKEVESDTVSAQLREIVPNYFKSRNDLLALTEYIASQRGRDDIDGRNATVLSNLIRNERI